MRMPPTPASPSLPTPPGLDRSPLTWIDNSRLLAIFAVILLHVAGPLVAGPDKAQGSQWWISNIADASVRWSVPVFVMLSGALLLAGDAPIARFRDFYRRRALKLLAPILFWSLFYLSWSYFNEAKAGTPPSLVALGKRGLAGSPYFHMWFLFMISELYLFVPFLKPMLKGLPRKKVIFLVAIMFALEACSALYSGLSLKTNPLLIFWFLHYLPYFILGGLISSSNRKPSIPLLVFLLLLFIGSTALGCYSLSKALGLAQGLYFYNYSSLTVIPMAVVAMFLLKGWHRPLFLSSIITNRMANMVLGIYLIHPLVIDLLSSRGFGPKAFNPAISIPVISLVVFFASALLAWLIHSTPYLKRVI